MMPRAKTRLGRFVENAITYFIIGIIVLGLALALLSPILKMFGINL